ncbi:hypothetical protein M404DRAFT_1005561 [Pisolithus tinctorius Marx 270]|uniref:Nephrocystin 3-like N-terminal domain-containing protein n=1 Tax=Pisolithus tinctorius Marx 270 TaxID=870435 RepID=A0A0C3JKU1_PISTI|nr:hypothetical protein M404DRAFT_1005561 [Pisolithus tinctorius Marx 270]
MARSQPRKRRLRYIGEPPSSAPNVSSSQGQSQAPVGGVASSPGHSSHGFKGKLAAMKSRFIQSHRGPSISSANPIASEGAQENPGSRQVAKDVDTRGLLSKANLDPDPALVGDDVDVARQAFESIKPIPCIGQMAVETVAQASTAVAVFQNLSSTHLQPLKIFNDVVTTIENVHPYAQIALGILRAASQLIITEATLDNAISELLRKVASVYAFLLEDDTIKNIDTIKVPLAKIARVISACAQFIKDYSEVTNFWKRLGRNIMSETQTAIDDYTKTLDELMQQLRDCQTQDVQINVYRVIEDLNMEGMAYAGGAGLNMLKKCLENTRTEILRDIINWVNDTRPDAPCVLWLHGQAGGGKSTIAHTIASWLKDVGGLGSCFCFARDRQAERREEKMLTTISCDLASRYPAFRRSLGRVLAEDPSLKTTPDLSQQWQKLILEPLLKAAGAIVGNVVLVIDALDESGEVLWRKHILSLLTSKEAANMSSVRILLTSRPLPDIERALRDAMNVRAICLDDVPAELTQRDITLFVSKELLSLKDSFRPPEIQQIVHKSNGSFEWARLACAFIRPYRDGLTVKERLDEVIALQPAEGRTLLDTTYSAILESAIPPSPIPLARFGSVMQQVLLMIEPVSMVTLDSFRECFPDESDDYNVAIILRFMAPMLDGVTNLVSPICLLHSSFYDFLTDRSRSGVYFVDTSNSYDLTFASLRVLSEHLQFNICGLESSYLSNSEIPDLAERINKNIPLHLSYSCRFWAQHLQKTAFDPILAGLVVAIVGSEKILFWLEIMSLLGEVGQAADALFCTTEWLQGPDGVEDILTLVQDGIAFIQNFGSVIAHSSSHLYISALPFVPSNTMLSAKLMPKFSGLAKVDKGQPKEWAAAKQALQGHTSLVNSVAFSPDGKTIVSGSDDKIVRIWNAGTGEQMGGPLQGHMSWVQSVAFSPDGGRVASGSDDKTVRVWDVEKGMQIGGPLQGHTDWVQSVAFSPDSKRVVSGSYDNTVRVWDVERGVQIGSPLLGHTASVNAVAFSHDGRKIVSASDDHTVRVWDVKKGGLHGTLICGHTSTISSAAFSYDSRRIVSGSDDMTIRVWDAKRGVQIGNSFQGHTDWVQSVTFSPDRMTIVSGSYDKTVRIWDVGRGVQIGSPLQGHDHWVQSVAFSLDGRRIVSGSYDNTLRVWDAQGYKNMINLKLPTDNETVTTAYSICFSSSSSSHALQGSDQLLDGVLQEEEDVRSEPVKLHSDGWIRGPKRRLLLWIPPMFRVPFYSMWNTAVIPRGSCIELDLSQMVHGNKWHECYVKS